MHGLQNGLCYGWQELPPCSVLVAQWAPWLKQRRIYIGNILPRALEAFHAANDNNIPLSALKMVASLDVAPAGDRVGFCREWRNVERVSCRMR